MTAFDGLRRHLRGWQLAVAAVGTALGGVALALPRPVAPCELPLPDVDRTEERAASYHQLRYIPRNPWWSQALLRPRCRARFRPRGLTA